MNKPEGVTRLGSLEPVLAQVAVSIHESNGQS
jgi:hypothetical protein